MRAPHDTQRLLARGGVFANPQEGQVIFFVGLAMLGPTTIAEAEPEPKPGRTLYFPLKLLGVGCCPTRDDLARSTVPGARRQRTRRASAPPTALAADDARRAPARLA